MDKDAKKRVFVAFSAEKEGLRGLTRAIAKDFPKAIEILKNRGGKIIVTGVGKSGFIAMKIAATLTSLGHGAFYLNPLDALHGDAGMIREGDVLIAISFSGESPELLKLLRHLKKNFGVSVVCITGRKASSLARTSDAPIHMNISKEGCPLGLAPMASTTTSLVVGDLIAAALTSPADFHKEHFAKFHPAGSLGLSLKKVKEIMTKGGELPRVPEDALLSNALKEITEKKLGITAVVDEKENLTGAITDGDIRRILMKYDNPKKIAVKNIMTKKPKSIDEEETLRGALTLMEKHKISSLFVTNGTKKLKGIIHLNDILDGAIR